MGATLFEISHEFIKKTYLSIILMHGTLSKFISQCTVSNEGHHAIYAAAGKSKSIFFHSSNFPLSRSEFLVCSRSSPSIFPKFAVFHAQFRKKKGSRELLLRRWQ